MTEETRHTPGPWKFRWNGLYSGDFPILWVTQGYDGRLYLGANADDEDIIANAPDMFATLEQIQSILAEWDKSGNLFLAGKDACQILELSRAALRQVLGDAG